MSAAQWPTGTDVRVHMADRGPIGQPMSDTYLSNSQWPTCTVFHALPREHVPVGFSVTDMYGILPDCLNNLIFFKLQTKYLGPLKILFI